MLSGQNEFDLDEDITLSNVWRNLLFMKDGRSLFGAHIHASESEARAAAAAGAEYLAEKLRLYSDVLIYDEPNGQGNFLYKATEYSHAIQIPVASKAS